MSRRQGAVRVPTRPALDLRVGLLVAVPLLVLGILGMHGLAGHGAHAGMAGGHGGVAGGSGSSLTTTGDHDVLRAVAGDGAGVGAGKSRAPVTASTPGSESGHGSHAMMLCALMLASAAVALLALVVCRRVPGVVLRSSRPRAPGRPARARRGRWTAAPPDVWAFSVLRC